MHKCVAQPWVAVKTKRKIKKWVNTRTEEKAKIIYYNYVLKKLLIWGLPSKKRAGAPVKQ